MATTAATMSPIDALNEFGRTTSPFKLNAPVQSYSTFMSTAWKDGDDEELEEDEDFLLGRPSTSKDAQSADHQDAQDELEEDEAFLAGPVDREDTPPYPSTSASTSRNAQDGHNSALGAHKQPEPVPDLEMDLEEDEAFMAGIDTTREDTPPYPGTASAAAVVDRDATPPYRPPPRDTSNTPPYPSTGALISEAGREAQQVDAEDDLEEDPGFFVPPSTAGPSSIPPSSPPPRLSSPPAPSSPHINRDVTAHRLDVTNVDLGRRAYCSSEVVGTSYSGQRIRFKRRRDNALLTGASSLSTTGSSGAMGGQNHSAAELGKLAMSLLEKPIHVMLDELAAEKAKEEKEKKEETIHRNLVDAYQKPVMDRKKGKAKAGKAGEIWTDRYKPKTFTELLGDERTHRQAMSWLKEWDPCVFKHSSAGAAARKKQLKRARDAAAAAGGVEGDQYTEYADPLGRPKDKVLLLTGPPGLGKTTLAHVIASQAGYRVSEINASDDRSAKIVQDRVRQSLESTTLTSLGSLSSSKPTCLVIDEIDGAAGGDAGFIKTLVKLIMDGSKASAARAYVAGDKAFGGKGKKKDAVQPLQRPIICICNDLYVPALRPLRAIARIVRFHAPTNAMLTKRLRHICDIEKLKADHKTLTTLVEVAEGDMRSCLNTLQIVRAQRDTLDVQTIKSTALGLKDTATSVTAVWDKLFKIPAKNRTKGIDERVEGKFINHLVKDIITCGEYEKLAQSCFENYLKGKTPADELAAVSRALEWLLFYDDLNARLRNERDYDVMPYMPYAFVPWNPIFAAVSNKTPDWPRVDYEMYLKRTAHQEIADTLAKALPANVKGYFTGQSIVAELAPLLMRIVTPDLKPVNQQLIKGEDRLAMRKLVRAMLDFNVSYVEDRNEEGQVVYRLDPPIEVFVHYDGKRPTDLPASRFNLRQLIAKELAAETMRRASGNVDTSDVLKSAKNVSNIMQAYKSTKGEQIIPTKAAPVALDFFGRPVIAKPVVVDADKEVDENMAPEPERPNKRVKVFYKYHEGFSNAVRTNVKVAELFR